MPTLIVTDANILIDLAIIERHDLLFLPDWSTLTTYDVFYELRNGQQLSWQPYIDSGELTLEEVPEELIAQMRSEVPAKLSDPDCTVLVLAELKKAIILSGDGPIVKTFRSRGKEAHGTLWLLDQNELAQRYVPEELHAFLSAIIKINGWLPVKECQYRLHKWGEDA
jgi:hypothetical protein